MRAIAFQQDKPPKATLKRIKDRKRLVRRLKWLNAKKAIPYWYYTSIMPSPSRSVTLGVSMGLRQYSIQELKKDIKRMEREMHEQRSN